MTKDAKTRSTRAARAPPAPEAPTPALTKDDWLSRFEAALIVDFRPDIGRKFARVVAVDQWTVHREMDPREAARQWANRKP